MQATNHYRDLALLEAVLCGTASKTAGDRFGVSTQRVRKVCRRLLLQLRHASPMDEVMPEHNLFKLSELRAHKDFWMRRLEKLRAGQCSDAA